MLVCKNDPLTFSPSTKQLHSKQSEDYDKQEEEEEQTDDGLHGAHEGNHQVP